MNIDDRVDMTSSWFKIHKARCWESSSERRPLIFTFYELASCLESEDPIDLLKVWKDAWIKSGWEPITLMLGDAKRHPNYESLVKTLDDSLQFEDSKD